MQNNLSHQSSFFHQASHVCPKFTCFIFLTYCKIHILGLLNVQFLFTPPFCLPFHTVHVAHSRLCELFLLIEDSGREPLGLDHMDLGTKIMSQIQLKADTGRCIAVESAVIYWWAQHYLQPSVITGNLIWFNLKNNELWIVSFVNAGLCLPATCMVSLIDWKLLCATLNSFWGSYAPETLSSVFLHCHKTHVVLFQTLKLSHTAYLHLK